MEFKQCFVLRESTVIENILQISALFFFAFWVLCRSTNVTQRLFCLPLLRLHLGYGIAHVGIDEPQKLRSASVWSSVFPHT